MVAARRRIGELPDVHYGLATVYFQLRELTSAAHHFREVTRLDSHRAGAFVNLGAVLNLLQQYDEAIVAFGCFENLWMFPCPKIMKGFRFRSQSKLKTVRRRKRLRQIPVGSMRF